MALLAEIGLRLTCNDKDVRRCSDKITTVYISVATSLLFNINIPTN